MVSAWAGQEFSPGGRYAAYAPAHRQTGAATPEEVAEQLLQETLQDIELLSEILFYKRSRSAAAPLYLRLALRALWLAFRPVSLPRLMEG